MGVTDESLLRIREKLLDLSPRNRLLNFRETTQSLRIVDEVPSQVFDTLVSEQKQMAFEAAPEDDGRETTQLDSQYPLNTELPFAADQSDKHNDLFLQTNLVPEKLETRCRRIIQNARIAIEESGTNILYLAMGFLEWYQPEEPEKRRLAPLILVPIQIERGRLSRSTKCYQYIVSYTGEDLETNLCLREKLSRDFDLVLPDLPEEPDVEAYFSAVHEVAASKKKWRVAREMLLGMFSFSKLLMYKDLGPDSWPPDHDISKHKNIRELMEGRSPDSMVSVVAEPYHEDVAKGQTIPLVLDADSSQHATLVDILNGRDQVVIGPPGTGKSQTITNLIAAAMAQGKSVLFVSEKLAALEVVRRRLEQVGLGDFCLELHSWKTQKRRLLDDIERRLKIRCDDSKTLDESKLQYEAAKEALNNYVRLVNSVASATDETIQQILWSAERWRTEKDAEGPFFRIQDPLALSRIEVAAKENILQDITNHLSMAPLKAKNAWRGYRPTTLLAGDEEQIVALLNAATVAIGDILQTTKNFEERTGRQFDISFNDLLNPSAISLNLPKDIPDPFDEEFAKKSLAEDFGRVLTSLESQQSSYRAALQNAACVLRDNVPTDYLNTVLVHVGALRTLNCAGYTITQLKNILVACTETREALTELEGASRPYVQLGFSKPDTLVSYERMITAAALVIDAPRELDHVISKHFLTPNIGTLFESTYSEFRTLEAEFAKQSPVIDFTKCPSNDDLLRIATIIREKQGSIFSFLSFALRKARKEAVAFLKMAAFSKSPTLPDRLTEVVALNHRVDAASTNLVALERLGPLFTGRKTDWRQLSGAIEWVKILQKELGSEPLAERIVLNMEKCRACLADAHIAIKRSLERVNNALLRCAGQRVINDINVFADNHPIAEQIEYFERHVAVLSEGIQALETTVVSAEHTSIAVNKAVVCRQNADSMEKEVQANGEFAATIGKTFKGIFTETKHLWKIANWMIDVGYARIPSNLKDWLLERDIVNRVTLLRTTVATFSQKALLVQIAVEGMTESGILSLNEFLDDDPIDVMLPAASNRLKECIAAKIDLMAWADYCRLAKKATEVGLSEMTSALERGEVKPLHLKEIFTRSLYDSMAKQVIKMHPELTHFSRATHERVRRQHAELDLKVMKEFQKQIAHIVSKRQVPYGVSSGYVREYTERGLIEHELSKKKKHIPIRQLVKRAARALKALKPCFMMSPLSVALYLEPAQIEFDLVVMDEASQLRPEEALGAIARGKQLVVVGDPKQLPPTSFFERVIEGNEEEQELETAADLAESILDVCLKTYRPARNLQWHYRSQHESLIAFSNRQFYESDLIVFPSPHGRTSGLGIVSHFVEGAKYSKGKNTAEGRVVAEAVVAHLLKYPNVSLGVGTFNAEQRDLILDLLDTQLKECSAAQKVIDEMQNGNEPFFVKNLENIQGDERDVIFISTTYGPDSETGVVHQRFGPIAGPTGWRRLNVMFTRAKRRVELFTSLQPSDIRVSESTSRGALALKAYLVYALTGKFSEPGTPSERSPDSDFEISVARVVESMGFRAVPQIGVDGFFIDIGVPHPHSPGEFILGIECDGATYHSARSARDRDRLRQEILEKRNWKLHRIWSTEWFKNRDIEVNRLQHALFAASKQPT